MIREHNNPRFLPTLQRYEPITQDSTAMRAFKECNRKYFYQIVLGLVPKYDERHYILDFGSAYHKFREILSKEYLLATKDGATFSQVETAPMLYKAIQAATKDYKPKISPHSKKDLALYSPERLILCCGVAFQHWESEKKAEKFKVIAIEQPFNAKLPDDNVIGGRADEIVTWNGRIWDRDFKTSSKDKNMFTRGIDPNDQPTRYIYGLGIVHGEPIGGVIYELMLNIEGRKPVVDTVILQKNRDQLRLWEREQLFLNKVLDMCREDDIWPMSDCGNAGGQSAESQGNCAWCRYKPICASSNEIGMKQIIKTNYDVRPWRMEEVEQKVIL